MSSQLQWHGDAVLAAIRAQLDARMERAGAAGVQAAQALVPVRTGQTKASIGFTYDRSQGLLQLHAGTPWAVDVELGTRCTPARPFLRPALDAAAKALGNSS